MAGNGIIRNDKTGAIMAHIVTSDGCDFVNSKGKRFPNGLGCPGGWTMIKFKTLDTSKIPATVKAEIEKVSSEKVYGSNEDPSVFSTAVAEVPR